MANLGVPIKLLHESLGHIITVELKTGEVSFCTSTWPEDKADSRCTEGN